MTKSIIETDILELILILASKIQKYWDSLIFKDSWITLLQFNILWVINLYKWCTINQLKKSLIVSSASLSQTLNRMEKISLIKRQIWTIDKREILLKTTKKWTDIYNRLNKIYLELAKSKLNKIDKSKKLQLKNDLTFLNNSLWNI